MSLFRNMSVLADINLVVLVLELTKAWGMTLSTVNQWMDASIAKSNSKLRNNDAETQSEDNVRRNLIYFIFGGLMMTIFIMYGCLMFICLAGTIRI